MYKFKFLILLIFFSVSNNLFAQDKFEKESRIKPEDVPTRALVFIDSLSLKSKVKWYKEEGLNKESIEAKFKLDKVMHSVEFDTLGMIEDVEIDVNWKDMESHLKDSIFFQLKVDCSSHKIIKVQRQLIGSENDLLTLLKSGNFLENLKIKYEIIIRCKHQNEVNLFEYLFNNEGKLISKSKIIFKNSSHLEY
jgi:hypothetical protein